MNKCIRIAHIIGKWFGGGVESVVMNYYRNIDKSRYQFDFICDEDSTNIPYDEIIGMGGKVFLIPSYKNIIEYQKSLKKILEEGNYLIIHSHINTLSIFSLFAAKRAGIPIRIAHSHSTTSSNEFKKNIIKQILRPFSKCFATHYFACTEYAGRWLFGNKALRSKKIFILNNAIDTTNFEYNENVRNKLRKDLNIKDNVTVIGHVGRFVEQKNHDMIIEIFKNYHKYNKDSILILVGQGPLEEKIKRKVDRYGLHNYVLFIGQKNNISDYYQLFDFFLFPSLYEGLGMVVIEAQISHLPCLCSNDVPKIVKINGNVEFLDLHDNPLQWAKLIDKMLINNVRKSCYDNALKFGYDIKHEVHCLEEKYDELLGGKL